MEHVFGIRSRDTALLMAGNEISQILFIFAMPVIVKVKKRPFWTAIGLFCSALGLFLMAIPHWVKPVDEVSSKQLQRWTEDSTLIFENLKPVEKSKNNFSMV